eukprot:4188480-Amphidinium_carterae.1
MDVISDYGNGPKLTRVLIFVMTLVGSVRCGWRSSHGEQVRPGRSSTPSSFDKCPHVQAPAQPGITQFHYGPLAYGKKPIGQGGCPVQNARADVQTSSQQVVLATFRERQQTLDVQNSGAQTSV